MTYKTHTITSIMGIPDLICDFARALGWSVSDNVLTRPGGGRRFAVTATISGRRKQYHRLWITDTDDGKRKCGTQLPWLNGEYQKPDVAIPSKLHLFGNDCTKTTSPPDNSPWTDPPWIGIVVECGYNRYRHLYIGNLNKIGDYDGGEVIAANAFYGASRHGDHGTRGFFSSSHKYLFSCHTATWDDLSGKSGGGANIVHTDNPKPWRVFDGPTGYKPDNGFKGHEILGGIADSIHTGAVTLGLSDFAGANILTPVNLYITDLSGGAGLQLRPAGHLPGVRMINMNGLDPGVQLKIASKNWRVFPEFSKQGKTIGYGKDRPDDGAGGYYPEYETSWNLGLAWQEA